MYYGYGVVDRAALETHDVEATVVSKHYDPSRKAFNKVIAGNRVWVQSHETGGLFLVNLRVNQEETVGLVTRELFDSLDAGDRVHAKVRRTRISRRLEAIEVTSN